MFKKGKSPLASILIISLIGILGFKDTGIFIKDYMAKAGDDTEISFKSEESVNILGERDRDYIIEKDYEKYYVPKDLILKTQLNPSIFKVKKSNTYLMDMPNGRKIKDLNIGEQLKLESREGGWGLFITTDNIKGYMLFENLEEEKVITIGISQVDKTLKGANNTFYVLLKGEPVMIKDFSKGNFIIIDEDGKEFKAHRDYISLRNSRHTTSRSGGITSRTSKINAIISNAHKALGKPYKRGATGPNAYDCSGLTYSLYLNHAGVKLNRSSKEQVKNGMGVEKSELVPGDIVLFRTSGKSIGHAGLYIGDGNMIHASSGKNRVMVTPIDQDWYKKRYVTARRIIK